MDKEQKNRFNF